MFELLPSIFCNYSRFEMGIEIANDKLFANVIQKKKNSLLKILFTVKSCVYNVLIKIKMKGSLKKCEGSRGSGGR